MMQEGRARLRSVAALLAAAALALATSAAPLAAQPETAPPTTAASDPDPAAGPTEPAPVGFPAPLVATMLSPAEPASLAVRSFYAEPGTDKDGNLRIVVQFAAPYTLPPDGYRLSVFFGEPNGRSVRASLRTEGGEAVGSLDVGTADAFAELGPIKVATSPDATALLKVPADALPEIGSVWLRAELSDPATTFISPLYPMDQFLGLGPLGELSASVAAWMTPPGETVPTVVQLPDPPTLTVEGTTVRLTYDEPPPTEVNSVLVSTMVDVVRIAPDYVDNGQAPFLVAVDHVARSVNLLDGTQLIPATLTPTNDDWLLTDLPGPVRGGTVVEFDLRLVAEQFGIPYSPDTIALGAARSVTLTDDTVVRADGVQGVLSWFEEGAALVEEPEDEVTAAPEESEELPWLLIIGVVAAVVIVGLGVLAVRRRARRRREQPGAHNEHLLDSANALTLGAQVPVEPLTVRRREGNRGGDPPGGAATDDGARRDSAGVPAGRADLDLRERGPAAPSDGRAAPSDGRGAPSDGAAAPGSLTTLFGAPEPAPAQAPIDVPELALFDESTISPAVRPPRPSERRRSANDDDLTKALFDTD